MTDGGGDQPGIFERQLGRQAANYAPLSPLSFLARAAAVFPDKTAVIDGERRFSWRDFALRCRRLGAALASRGIGRGDTVAVLAGNVPATLEAHFGVPLIGAVLNALNIRQDAATIAFCLEHGEAKVLIVDREFSGEDEHGVAWDDPGLGIDWPVPSPVLSARDRRNPSLAEVLRDPPPYAASVG